ncbi:oligoendopeptidase F [Hyphomonas sp. WL0036]|uniref:oligoendopeptidase F n=1 Tax=Hyphomonas sediminis TaxID=2866160 RepID=UPI001C826A4A|nr:oligoendopeptidase F [Hyphomonas sediminis]MBY9066678.1 oligoendopeptidase F [Hyphomonas sediminis]
MIRDFSRLLKASAAAGVLIALGACATAPAEAPAAPVADVPVVAEPVAEAPAVEREQIAWDLTDLYETPEAWDAAFTEVQGRVAGLAANKGTLGKSAAHMADVYKQTSAVAKDAIRLYTYASLKNDEDQRDAAGQERFGKAQNLFQSLGEATSWMDPEVLSLGEKKVTAYLKAEPGLADFRFSLENTLRNAPHTLDDKGEALMAQAGLALSQPNQIYSLYANASIPWPSLTLADGTEVKLNQAGYSRYRSAANRDDRQAVFDTFWAAWKQYESGMGATLNAQVQSAIFRAKARDFDSVLQRNMFDDALPPAIYTQLVTQVNDALPVFHRYLKLRGRMLGVEDLRYYDIYPPIIEADTGTFDIERSKEITFEALKPFGEEYLGMLREGLSQEWMHVYPQEGKETGAYMSGSAYDVHPYVLLNHNDDYNSLSTFAHEWGHAVHTMLAKSEQPFETAGYSTFTAEIASTINEILLEEYMIEHAQTKEEKLYYLGYALESLRGTFYRQTMFGEFELAIHEAAERGEPLTGARLTEIYAELLRKYHGEADGVMKIDDAYTVEWAFIPHFYYEFYVYQYATSVSGAAWFAEQFLAGDEQVRDNFIKVLKAGGSAHPHDILMKEAGLDMTKPDAYQAVVRRMNDIMDRMEALLDEE